MPGVQELLVIAAVALLVFGPERLPELARGAGRVIARLRAEADRNIGEFRRLAEVEELERELREVREELRTADPRGQRPSTRRPRPVTGGPAAPGRSEIPDEPARADPEAT